METQDSISTEVDSHIQEDTLLRFRVGPFRFCIPAVEVEGIIIPPALTVIPLNPPHSKGVFLHHERLASAISLRSKFGLPDNDDTNLGQLILGEVKVGLVAFWVDEVYETVDSSELEWRAMPDFVPHAAFDRFAAKDNDVIMASTMQQLYDVPAEELASMLAGVRDSFDLPDDIPPVASDLANAESGFAEGSEPDQDAFGDLTKEEPTKTADSSGVENVKDSGVELSGDSDRKNVDGSGSEKESSDSSPQQSDNKPGHRAAVGSVVDLSARRSAQSANTVRNSSVTGSQTERHTAARTTASYASNSNIRAKGASDRSRPNAESRPAQHSFSGGVHSGAVNRQTQTQSPAGSQRYSNHSNYSQSSNNEQEEKKSNNGLWWTLAVLLLILLLAFWLWPNNKSKVTSVIPSQNYQSTPTFQEPISAPEPEPAPVIHEPETTVSSPAAIETPTSEPIEETVVTDEITENINTTDSNEVFRLEGEDVTVTVERNPVAITEEAAEPVAVFESKPIPGYDEFVHTVVKGDTLWDIAAKYLKNPFRYPELAQLSKINNPDLIYPGDTVRIRARKK